MKQLLLSLALCLCLLLTGCAGDTVIYQVACDHEDEPQVTPPPVVEPELGPAVKTGLAIITDRSASENAARAVFTATVAAVTVDDDGRICDAVLDGVYTKEELIHMLDRTLTLWKEQGIAGERFGLFLDRVGVDTFVAQLMEENH